jgi:hypothetical protein
MAESVCRVANSVLQTIKRNGITRQTPLEKIDLKKTSMPSGGATASGQERREQLKFKYGNKSLLDQKTQRGIYWLSIDQIIPPPLIFRDNLTCKFNMEWEKVDRIKIFSDSKMQAFQLRSTHGKL